MAAAPRRQGTPRFRLTRALQRTTRERAEKADSRFSTYSPAFIIPLGVLMPINALVSPDLLWSLIPLSGGSLSLLHYYLGMRARRRDAQELGTLPPLDDQTLAEVRSLFASRRGLRRHVAAGTVAVALVGTAALLFDPGAWWLVPAVGATGGVLALHYAVARRRQRQIRTRLREAGIALGAAQPGTGNTAAEVPERVVQLCDRILDDLQQQGEVGARWHRELAPEIDDYLYHLHRLLNLRVDLDHAGAEALASWKIEVELRKLRRKLGDAPSEALKRQYQQAIDQCQRQLHSLRDLEERNELIDLQAKSAVSALQQISLDVSRLKSAGEPLPRTSLRDRARELSAYVDDLQAGYRQLARDG